MTVRIAIGPTSSADTTLDHVPLARLRALPADQRTDAQRVADLNLALNAPDDEAPDHGDLPLGIANGFLITGLFWLLLAAWWWCA